jgi:hypothetical protein
MAEKPSYRPYLVRLAIVLAISVALALIFNEVVYRVQKERTDRAPETITLTIPAGTAQLVQAGQDTPSIPEEMVFVVGDVLEVKNEDSVSHQLGPIWVPAGSTGRLVMERPENLAYECSFQTSRYLGLDVRQPTTFGTRLVALAVGAPAVATLLFLYSLLVFPVRPAVKAPVSEGS